MASDAPPLVPQRLQKVLSRAGVVSRRAAEALITAGRVRVNGAVVTTLGTKVVPGRDVVAVDGADVGENRDELQTWMVHKPQGMMTTLSDPQGRPTVRRLVADLPVRLFPVGRLDWDADGLLLMSNDGDLTHQLTHPRFGVERTYRALVKGRVLPETIAQLTGTVALEDGPVQVLAVTASPGDRRSMLTITVAEGRNHLVKRLCDAVGHEVERLTRLAYGGVSLGDLPAQARRRLTEEEVSRLRHAVEKPSPPGYACSKGNAE